MTIRWRLTLVHSLTILAIAGGLLGLSFIILGRGIPISVEATARGHAIEAAWLLQNGEAIDSSAVRDLGGDGVYLIVRDPGGQVVMTSGDPILRFDRIDTADRDALWQAAIATGAPGSGWNGGDLELYGFAAPVQGGGPARVIEAWMSYDAQVDVLVPLLAGLTFVIPLVIVVAIAGAWLMARQAMAPVDAIVRAAREIGGSDPSRRLPVRHPNDELGRLATTFNEGLGRLDTALGERERALDEQRRFVADASHELRTPLTSIRGYARMLDEWAHEDPATARESAAAIAREAGRMQRLVEDLLVLARGDEAMLRDAGDDDRVAVDLVPVVAGAIADAGIAGDRVPIRFHPPAEPVRALIYPERIHQVLMILLDNSVRYTPDDDGDVDRPVDVTVGFVGPGPEHPGDADARRTRASVRVADRGIGVPPGQEERIFQRFVRGDASRTTPGTGLGLAIARQLAEAHGGTLTAAPRAGSGATFTLTLPALEDAGATGAAGDGQSDVGETATLAPD